jgi:lincosamide and streptogramin A transport system ATP-binding/permease protein
MASIILEGASFAYEGGDPVFQDLSLSFDTKWRLGLVGRNGRGKTTFLKILADELVPQGRVIAPPGLRLFPFGPVDLARDAYDLLRQTRPGSPKWALERKAGLIGLPEGALERPMGELSGGERVKAMLSILFLEDDDFPLIDEPTGGLDLEGRRLVARYLSLKRGFVLASHDRALLDGAADHVLALNRQGPELVRVVYSPWEEGRRRAEREEEAKAYRLNREAARLKRAAEKGSRWALKAEGKKLGNGPFDRGFLGAKAAKMMKRAKAVSSRRERALSDLAATPRNAEILFGLSLSPLVSKRSKLAEGAGLSCGYAGSPAVFSGLQFSLESGGRIALAGPNGSGKSLLLKLLSGRLFFSAPGTLAIEGVSGSPLDANAGPGGADAYEGAGDRGTVAYEEAGGRATVAYEETGDNGEKGFEASAVPSGRVLREGGIWTEGHFRIARGLKISYVPQEPVFWPGETLRARKEITSLN